jgi:hypothetical protein
MFLYERVTVLQRALGKYDFIFLPILCVGREGKKENDILLAILSGLLKLNIFTDENACN